MTNIAITSDGYKFRRKNDGTWTDDDITYESFDELHKATGAVLKQEYDWPDDPDDDCYHLEEVR